MYFTLLANDLQNRIMQLRAAAGEQRGAAMAEYGLLLALVALAAIGILALFGEALVDIFTDATEAIQDEGNVPAEVEAG